MDDRVTAPHRRYLAPLRRLPWWAKCSALLIVVVALFDVVVTGPRVSVRWRADVSPADRVARERRYDLRNGEPDSALSTWQYELRNRSRANIGAIVHDPAAEDTHYIDRDALTAPAPDIRLGLRRSWYPLSDLFDRPSQLLRLHPSLWLLLAGGVLLWAARALGARGRRNVTIATLVLIGTMMVVFPLDPSFVEMGESREHAETRTNFERYFGVGVRFEKHLSQTMLFQLYRRDPTDAAPERAMILLSRGAAVWFLLSALAIGIVERWSPVVLRYLGLAVLAPATLLYFGWREFGYLSLNVAAFPLLVRGLRDGGTRIEAGSVLTGLGAALHGAGLVALAGAWLAAVGAAGRLRDRFDRAVRITAWGTAAYLGWIAVYVIVLKYPIQVGPTGPSGWRPWLVDEIREGRVSAAVLSATGTRDLAMIAWIVGMPLLIVALSRSRQYSFEARAAVCYAAPSILFLIFRWPFWGLGVGMDLAVAGFPALYALAWLCAHDGKRTAIAAALLASAHLAFWRVVLDPRFENVPIS